MKTIFILVLLIAIAGICNAQSEPFNEVAVKTFFTKAKPGMDLVDVKFFDNVEFQKICSKVEKKNQKKLGEIVISPENLSKDYYCTTEKGDISNMVCVNVFEVDEKKKIVKLEFKIINVKGVAGKRILNKFSYHVTKDCNYAIVLRANRKDSYTFLISPNEDTNLAKN